LAAKFFVSEKLQAMNGCISETVRYSATVNINHNGKWHVLFQFT